MRASLARTDAENTMTMWAVAALALVVIAIMIGGPS